MNTRRIAWAVVVTLAVSIAGGAWLWAQGPQPSIGALTMSPPNIVFNTPTPTTFVVRINTPTINPTSVSLQRVDSTGRVLSTVGPMNDMGKTGDAVADDRNFSIRTSVNHPLVGKVYYRVTAAFRGNTPSAVSTIVSMDVDPFILPPDPGEAGKQTLAGIDSDSDGVRDDVQRWIELTYSDAAAKSLLTRHAQTLHDILLATTTADLLLLTERRRRVAACWNYLYPQDNGQSLAIESERIVNTEVRAAARLAATYRLPSHEFKNLPKGSAVVCQ